MVNFLTRCLQRLSALIVRFIFTMMDSISECRKKTFFILQYIILGLLCVGVDYVVSLPSVRKSDYIRALCDNTGHALIAAVSWLIVSGIHKEGILQGVFCGLMSSALDIDHFVLAKSLTIKDAISLNTRPPLHTTTIVPMVTPILQVWCGQNMKFLQELPYMFVIAVLTHHLRDSHRRGLWFWPFGSTPPLPYGVYIICMLFLPMVVKDSRTGIKRLTLNFKKPIPAIKNTKSIPENV